MTHWTPESLFWIVTGSIVALWGLADIVWRRAARSSRRPKSENGVSKANRR
jgi:hypothetical protein